MYDYLIVGAGFSGLVCAERLCTQYGKRCLLLEKRSHIGGNCYEHQVLPADGYTRLFENMISRCGSLLEIRLNTDYQELSHSLKWGHMIFTGPIDAYFDHRHGPLPYRTLRFEREHYTQAELLGNPEMEIAPGFIQPAVQVNYPGPEPWTRCVEAKHITQQAIDGSTLIKEYPETYTPDKEPYYPIPLRESRKLYQKYKADAEELERVSFLGRLGTYSYVNMDEVVLMALNAIDKLIHGGRT